MSTTYTKGNYQAEVLEQGFEESSAKKTPCFYLQLRILGCYADDKLQECPHYERTYRQYLANDTCIAILRGDLKSLGVELVRPSQLDPRTPNHISLVGRKIDVSCKIETYDGRPQERWAVHRPREKMSLDAVRGLDDRFSRPSDGTSPTQPAPEVAVPNTSDAPF